MCSQGINIKEKGIIKLKEQLRKEILLSFKNKKFNHSLSDLRLSNNDSKYSKSFTSKHDSILDSNEGETFE